MSAAIARRVLGLMHAARGAPAAADWRRSRRARGGAGAGGEGASDKAVAEKLGVTRSTVKNCLLTIYGKWRVNRARRRRSSLCVPAGAGNNGHAARRAWSLAKQANGCDSLTAPLEAAFFDERVAMARTRSRVLLIAGMLAAGWIGYSEAMVGPPGCSNSTS